MQRNLYYLFELFVSVQKNDRMVEFQQVCVIVLNVYINKQKVKWFDEYIYMVNIQMLDFGFRYVWLDR